jgi:PPK2 family polyphosphate:nucleotide phosphotransferase
MKPHPPDTPIRLTEAMTEPPEELPRGEELDDALERLSRRLNQLQLALAAENTRALLVVLQGRDASGKDGTIRRVFTGLNPAFCTVTSFRRPVGEETRHDYLWRVHHAAPARGTIGVFNRSHYEDVLAVRVHDLVPRSVWEKRFDHINQFERLLTDEGTVVRKFLLHVSRKEQRERLEERLKDPSKNWKFDEGDLGERELWDRYTEAYQEILARCSPSAAPWYVVPADRNKPRDYLVLEVLVRTLEEMDPQYPRADPALLERLGKIS